MIRTQIQLTEEQASALKQMASRAGVSVAEIVRQAVQRAIDLDREEQRWKHAADVAGRFQDNATDVATQHDQYLADIYG